MKRSRSEGFLRLLAAAVCTLSLPAGAFAAGLDLSVNWTALVAGDPIVVSAHAAPLSPSFDAWAVILSPDGQMYFMSLAGSIAPGAIPLARAVPGLPSDVNATLLSMRIPAGIARGEYTAVAAFMPAGTIPTSIEDAEARAIPGCFARAPFYVISGRISTDISGEWAVTLNGLGEGVMTVDQSAFLYLVDGEFEGDIGNASLLGFVDLDTFTLFLDFAEKPARTDMTLSGSESGGTLAGTYSSDFFSPPSGTWTAVRAH